LDEVAALLLAACFGRSRAAVAAADTYIGRAVGWRQGLCVRQIRGFTMKITIDIDCTPEEARAFLGLPDVAPLQAEMMKEMQERMMKTLAGMDAEKLMKTWLSGGMQTLEQMRAFWEQMARGGPKGSAS
jgi:hypothetical protein